MQELYFDDIPLNQPWTSKGEYLVQEDELIAFAKKWDPLPMHTDSEAARSTPLGGLIAPATYTLAVASALSQRFDTRALIIGGNEWKVKFPQPVRLATASLPVLNVLRSGRPAPNRTAASGGL